MDLKQLEIYQELYKDIEEFDLVDVHEFIDLCVCANSLGEYESFENTVSILADTSNLDGLDELFERYLTHKDIKSSL